MLKYIDVKISNQYFSKYKFNLYDKECQLPLCLFLHLDFQTFSIAIYSSLNLMQTSKKTSIYLLNRNHKHLTTFLKCYSSIKLKCDEQTSKFSKYLWRCQRKFNRKAYTFLCKSTVILSKYNRIYIFICIIKMSGAKHVNYVYICPSHNSSYNSY